MISPSEKTNPPTATPTIYQSENKIQTSRGRHIRTRRLGADGRGAPLAPVVPLLFETGAFHGLLQRVGARIGCGQRGEAARSACGSRGEDPGFLVFKIPAVAGGRPR